MLLVNLGTPDAPTSGAVRRYLRQFLSDPRVVDVPRWLWWPLLYLFILPTRPRRSAHAYRTVWGEDGSPLLAISRRQQAGLQRRLGDSCHVALAMRYGRPAIPTALAALCAAGVRHLLVLPLYPQYCAATTASTYDGVGAALARQRRVPALRMVDHYHDHPAYLSALAGSVRRHRRTHGDSDILLMSFHGIPQRFADEGDPYPQQCRHTAHLLAQALGLEQHQWRLCFQSRFGREPWLQPYTDHTLAALGREGRSVQVICPGFSADCLETLEEMAITGREQYEETGGKSFSYIPCLNDDDEHIDALARILGENMAGWRDER